MQRYGGVPLMLGIARDNLEDMHRKLNEGLTADLLLTSAGVSKGDYDIVKDVLAERGKVNFWSVRMRPAKPLAWGMLKGEGDRLVPHLGLPGNPVSAMVAFEEFGRPAILRMLGRTDLAKPTVRAELQGADNQLRWPSCLRPRKGDQAERQLLRHAHGPPGVQHPDLHGAGQRACYLPGGSCPAWRAARLWT